MFTREELHKARLAGITLEIFEWQNEGERILYNITAMRADIASNPDKYSTVYTLTNNLAPFIANNRDFESAWCHKLTAEQIEEPAIAIVEEKNGTLEQWGTKIFDEKGKLVPSLKSISK